MVVLQKLRSTAFGLFDKLVHDGKLTRPIDIVQKLAQIEAIVIGRVAFGVVRRGDGAHFVSVHGIEAKKSLYLFGDQTRGQVVPDDAELAVPALVVETQVRRMRMSQDLVNKCTVAKRKLQVSHSIHHNHQETTRPHMHRQTLGLTLRQARTEKSFVVCQSNRVLRKSCPFLPRPVVNVLA